MPWGAWRRVDSKGDLILELILDFTHVLETGLKRLRAFSSLCPKILYIYIYLIMDRRGIPRGAIPEEVIPQIILNKGILGP